MSNQINAAMRGDSAVLSQKSVIETSHNKAIKQLFRGDNRILAGALMQVFADLRSWWPLTVRQGFYQCVSRGDIENAFKNYRRCSTVLTDLRRAEILPWIAVSDRTRYTVDKRGIPDVSQFLTSQFDEVFNEFYYSRCYVQKQQVYVELCIEKDALAKIAQDAIWRYCTRLNVIRGFPSSSIVNEIANRCDKAMMSGQTPILLHCGDLDPSGIAIPVALQNSLEEHHGLSIEVRQIALTLDQVKQYELPANLEPAKKTDTRTPAWRKLYGDMHPYELDAIHPKLLRDLIDANLQSVYDMTDFDNQRIQEKRDRELIKQVRQFTQDALIKQFPDIFNTVQ